MRAFCIACLTAAALSAFTAKSVQAQVYIQSGTYPRMSYSYYPPTAYYTYPGYGTAYYYPSSSYYSPVATSYYYPGVSYYNTTPVYSYYSTPYYGGYTTYTYQPGWRGWGWGNRWRR